MCIGELVDLQLPLTVLNLAFGFELAFALLRALRIAEADEEPWVSSEILGHTMDAIGVDDPLMRRSPLPAFCTVAVAWLMQSFRPVPLAKV
eukprot:11093853-Prorocentrum_lima.AAC.1